ncbi:hypothetical protein D3C80_1864620 [compost metagenome]
MTEFDHPASEGYIFIKFMMRTIDHGRLDTTLHLGFDVIKRLVMIQMQCNWHVMALSGLFTDPHQIACARI